MPDATGTPTTNFSIPKYNTGTDAPSGKGFNEAMDFLDALLANNATLLGARARLAVRKNSGGSDFIRRRLNLIEGTGVTLTVADDAGNEEVDVTIAAAGGTQGTEMIYTAITSDVAISATTEGTANTVVTGTSQTYENVPYMVHFYAPTVMGGAGVDITFVLLRGATVVAQWGKRDWTGSGDDVTNNPLSLFLRDTPPASTFSYTVKAFVSGSTGTVKAGASGSGTLGPAFIRVTKV